MTFETFEFVFPEAYYVDFDFGFLFPSDAPAVEDFIKFLNSKRIKHLQDAFSNDYIVNTKIFHFPDILERALSLDIPIWRSGGRRSQVYFSSKIIAPWKQRADGSYCQEVPENQCWPGTWERATAEPIPYEYKEGRLEVVRGIPKYREHGWWPACEFEDCRDMIHSRYKGFDIRYKPSRTFLMRFGAYPQGGTRAIAITRSVEACQRAIDARLGEGPREFDAVLGGKSPGPRHYDAVLGSGHQKGNVVTIKKAVAQIQPADWSFLDDEEVLEVD